MYAAGKISEEIWDSLWSEWQDRRNQVRRTLETLFVSQQVHLERKDQKELLRQVVHRVVVNDTGNVSFELRTPFAYLRDLTDEMRMVKEHGKRKNAEKKNGRHSSAASSGDCSNQLLSCGENRIRTCDTRLPPYNRLAGGPIRPLWHLPNLPSYQRREWDSNPRCRKATRWFSRPLP